MEKFQKQSDISIAKMDKLIIQLKKYNLAKVYTEKPVINLKVIPESPEYYANEYNNFLIDNCKEKDKRINLINKILNISIITNVILLAYILQTNYYFTDYVVNYD